MTEEMIREIILIFLSKKSQNAMVKKPLFGIPQFIVTLESGWRYEFDSDEEDIHYEKISPRGEKIRAGRVEFPPPWYI